MRLFVKSCLILLVLSGTGLPQTFSVSDQLADQKEHQSLHLRDGSVQALESNLPERLDIIVEFEGLPLFNMKKKNPRTGVQQASYRSRFEQFKNDLTNIVQTLNKGRTTINFQPVIEREFYKVFFGASLTIPSALYKDIGTLDYVKRVHDDIEIKNSLDESVQVIRADEVWQDFDTQGEGMVIGIFDTGIDYTHPALGGGFGEGFKVIGGYDVVNQDDDPMDDHGHGTHVAGITSADGDSIKGVAPKASLMAFKVLNSGGAGSASQLIEGLERAVDPNNDDDFSDRVDVINMSLGGGGNPYDVQSVAVNNAVELGVVCCIAAGNGSDYGSIESPGTATLAITVGATNNSDAIAPFSSRGPSPSNDLIKPEVVAPGVAINSTVLDNSFERNSGTSMATPHVAGVCALLKSLHPDWSPAQIKSAIMTTAVSIGDDVMTQGSGRVDAYAAASTGIFATPAHLSFGTANDQAQTWITSHPITFTNLSGASQTFDINVFGTSNGIAIIPSVNSFTLNSGEAMDIEFELQVINSMVPFKTTQPFSYDGYVTIESQDYRLRMPWAFVKANTLLIETNEPITGFFAISTEDFYDDRNLAFLSSTLYQMRMPLDTYDILVEFPDQSVGSSYNKFIFVEDYNFATSDSIFVSSEDAQNTLDYHGVDENNRPVSTKPNVVRMFRIIFPEGSPLESLATISSDSLALVSPNCSNVSDRFSFNASHFDYDLENEKAIRLVKYGTLEGISDNHILQNNPADFLLQNLEIDLHHDSNNKWLQFFSADRRISPNGNASHFGTSYDGSRINLSNMERWSGKVLIMPGQHERHDYTTFFSVTEGTQPVTGRPDVYMKSNPFVVYDNKIGSFSDRTPSPAVSLSSSGGTLHFHDAPVWPVLMASGGLRPNGGSEIEGSVSFYGSHHDERDMNTEFTVGADETGSFVIEVINDNYYLGGTRGAVSTTANLTITPNNRDARPPFLSSLQILNSKGKPTKNLKHGENGEMRFSIFDRVFTPEYAPIEPDSTRLYYKEFGTDEWTELPASVLLEDAEDQTVSGHVPTGFLYSADISGLSSQFDSSAVDIKLQFQDPAGNSTEVIIAPAFAIGDFGTITDIVEDDTPLSSLDYQLSANYPNPFNPTTHISFTIPVPGNVKVEVFDILGRKVSVLVDKHFDVGTHKLSFDGTDFSSGVYFYRIKTRTFMKTRKMLLIK